MHCGLGDLFGAFYRSRRDAAQVKSLSFRASILHCLGNSECLGDGLIHDVRVQIVKVCDCPARYYVG